MVAGKIIGADGAGYIGSYTVIELVERSGAEVVSINDLSNSSATTFHRIERISGRCVTDHLLDLCNKAALMKLFKTLGPVSGIIHFVAFRSVPDPMREPYKNYHDTINSLLNELQANTAFDVPCFIFSSSSSVYGNIEKSPVDEGTAPGHAEPPYAYTKQVGERIMEDNAPICPGLNATSLRYFNPAGAHISGLIGEDPIDPPSRLVQVFAGTAIDEQKELVVHGDDHATRDGSCIRDLVHVSDNALAHLKALQHGLHEPLMPNQAIVNSGSGNGVSVFGAIRAFEEVNGIPVNYLVGPRRSAYDEAIYSDTTLAEAELHWKAELGVHEMMRSAWQWSRTIRTDWLADQEH